MENIMIFDKSMKTRMGIICFIPAMCFLFVFVYYLTLVFTQINGAAGIVDITNRNYSTLFIMLATSAIIAAPVFIYCLVILARMKDLGPATKIKWIIFLSILCPIASALFWIFHIKDAPRSMPVYPDIT